MKCIRFSTCAAASDKLTRQAVTRTIFTKVFLCRLFLPTSSVVAALIQYRNRSRNPSLGACSLAENSAFGLLTASLYLALRACAQGPAFAIHAVSGAAHVRYVTRKAHARYLNRKTVAELHTRLLLRQARNYCPAQLTLSTIFKALGPMVRSVLQ